MTKISAALVLPATCLLLGACSSPSLKKPEGKAPLAPASYVTKTNGSFKLQPYKERLLENGLKIVFVRDTTLPRISLTLMVKTGSLQEPAAKAGLNATTAYLLEQGTQSKSATKVADEFGQLGSALDISPGTDVTTIYSDSLTTGAQPLLALFSDVAMNPAFKEGEISRIRSQLVASLQKKVDNPSTFADDKINEFVFGAHPYGRDVHGTPDTLKGLSKQDIIKHYLTFYRPNNSSLAVVGNFDEAFEKDVEDVFGKWTKRTIPEVHVEAPPEIDSVKVKLIVKKGLQQAQVRISTLGIARTDDDYLRLRLANEVLGGSFASRLNQKIRSELGLTYSIYSSFDVRKQRGSFEISTFTKNETAGKTLEETLKVLGNYLANGAQENEVTAARNQLIGQFPRAIETADRLAYNMLVLDFYGIPYDYLTDFNKNVEGIRLKDANMAMAKALNAQKLKVVIYGDEKIISQFESYKPEIERIK